MSVISGCGVEASRVSGSRVLQMCMGRQMRATSLAYAVAAVIDTFCCSEFLILRCSSCC